MKLDKQKNVLIPNPKGAKELKEAHQALSKMPLKKELVDFLKTLKTQKDTHSSNTSGGESSGVPLAAKDSDD